MAASATTSKMKKVATICQKQTVFQAPNAVLSVLMWGVNHTMGELDCVPAQPLIMASDFKAFSKASIHNSGYNECGAGLRAGLKKRKRAVFTYALGL